MINDRENIIIRLYHYKQLWKQNEILQFLSTLSCLSMFHLICPTRKGRSCRDDSLSSGLAEDFSKIVRVSFQMLHVVLIILYVVVVVVVTLLVRVSPYLNCLWIAFGTL